MTKDHRLSDLFDAVVDSVEDMAYRYETEDPDTRMMIVQLQATVAMATVLERQGLWKFLRTIYAAIFMRIKHPGVVDV